MFTASTQAAQDAGVLDLVSGAYTVTFSTDGPPGGHPLHHAERRRGRMLQDSDADPATGRASVVLPDPAPSGVDGEDLTVDAGVVLGETPIEQPTPQPTSPGPPPAQPEGAVLPATQEQRARLAIDQARRPSHRARRGLGLVPDRGAQHGQRHGAQHRRAAIRPGAVCRCAARREGATFRDGRLCWRVGTLAAGSTRTLRVTMQTERTLRRETVTNVVRVTANGVRSRSARARRCGCIGGSAAAVGRPGVTG